MPGNRAARGTVQLIIGQFCLFISGYLIAILLARGLGPEDYGSYGVILSVLFWVEQMSRLGIPNATTKLIVEDPEQAPLITQTSWMIAAIIFVVTFLLFWVSAPGLARLFHMSDGTLLFRLAGIDIPFFGMYYIYRGVSEGQRDFATLSIAGVVYGLGKALGVLILYLVGVSIEGALTVNIVGSIIALAYIASRTPIKPMHCHMTIVFPLLRLALPLAIGVLIASLLYQLDLWILKVLLPEDKPKAIGIYIAASQVARIPHLGVLAVTLVVFSSISRAIGHNNVSLAQRYVRGAVRFLWVVLLPVSTLIAVEAEKVMTLLYSAQYILGGNLLRILIFGFSLFAFLDTFLIILQARGEIYVSLGIGSGLIFLMVLLSLILIPMFGPLGAALAVTVTMGVGAVITGVIVYRRFGSMLTPSILIKVSIATAIVVAVGAQLSVTGPLLLLQYIGLITLYAFTLAMLGELTWQDLQSFALWQRESPQNG